MGWKDGMMMWDFGFGFETDVSNLMKFLHTCNGEEEKKLVIFCGFEGF